VRVYYFVAQEIFVTYFASVPYGSRRAGNFTKVPPVDALGQVVNSLVQAGFKQTQAEPQHPSIQAAHWAEWQIQLK
jgi:hypothetical protein